jgi:hypothetical protein
MGFFLFATPSRLTLGPTHPFIRWAPGALSPWLKMPGHEADDSPSHRAKFKNAWNSTSTPQYEIVVWYSIKHRDDFTFYIRLHL